MRLTLATALPLLARYAVQGACSTDPRVLQKINEARERLMSKPQNWKGKIQRFLFCANQACVTLPREIETVEAATVCDEPMKMRSKWYDVLEGGPGSGTLCGGDAVVDRGDGYVTFADFDQARNIKIYADVSETSGSRLLLQGFDENGNRVRTFDETSGAWVDGEYVGINNETPQVSSTVFSSLDGVQKPETNGFVRLYAFTAGITDVPATDVTTIAQWANDTPITPLTTMEDGGGDVPWDGELVSFEWLTGPEENVVNLNLEFTWDGDGNATVTDAFNADGNFMPLSGLIQLPESTITFTSFVDDGTFPNNFRFVATNFSELTSQTRVVLINRYVTHPAEYTAEFPSTATIDAEWVSGDEDVDIVIQATSNGTEWSFGSPNGAWTTGGNELSITMFDSIFTPYGVDSSLGEWQFDLEFTLDGDSIGRVQGTIQNFPMAPAYAGASITFRITRTITDAVPGTADYLSLMSVLHPDETHPSYRRYEVPRLRTGCNGNDSADTEKQVVIMAKLRYLPVKRDTDFLVIENIGALKHMLLAINEEEKGELAKALAYEAKADEILAQELANHIGDAASSNQSMQVEADVWAAGNIPNLL